MADKAPSAASNSNSSLLGHVRLEHLVAGISGGVTATLILHPLDLLKIRFAVNDGRLTTTPQYKGLKHAFSTIWNREGLSGLYRGVIPNVSGAGISWGLYFLFYNTIKGWMEGDNKGSSGPGRNMLAAATAGVMSLSLTNPIWVVKTRLCMQYSGMAELPEHKMYTGMVDALRKVYKHEGVKGLYKGFVPGLFGVSHGALQFMSYEELKKVYAKYRNTRVDVKLSPIEYLTLAATSKLFAATLTYPYQVVRARLQDQHHSYNGITDVISKMWRYEGIKAYYKGLVPNLLRVTPATAITFLVYENMMQYMLE